MIFFYVAIAIKHIHWKLNNVIFTKYVILSTLNKSQF